MRWRIGWRTLFLVLMLVTAHFFVILMPEAHAWHISVNPTNNHVGAGGTVAYTVSVDRDPGELLGIVCDQAGGYCGPPQVQLITDPIAGLAITFSPDTQAIPFTSTMTVHVDSSFSHPGPLTIHVYAHYSPGSPFPGPDDKVADVGLVVSATPTVITTTAGPVSGTDWAVLSVRLTPATPQVGDAVTLSMDMTALSSSKSFPQDVVVECQIDPPASSGGTECFFGTVAFPGPTGRLFTVTSKTPWATTPGTHTLMWDIATTGDPNPGDNAKTISFVVLGTPATEPPPPPPETEPPPPPPETEPPPPPPETEPPPSPPETNTTIPSPGPSFPDLTWIIIGILAVLIVIFVALALRRRQPAYQPTPPSQPTPPTAAEKPKRSSLYCVNCGTENPSTNEFCGKCGEKLLRRS